MCCSGCQRDTVCWEKIERLPKSTVRALCVLQCITACCSVLQCVAVCCSMLQRVAVCCSVLQCVAVCCSVLQCVAHLRSAVRACVLSHSTRTHRREHTSSRAHIDAFRSRRNAAHLRSTVYMCPFIHVFHSCCCVKFAHESSRTGKRSWDLPSCHLLDKQIPSCGNRCTYGVATVSRIDKIIGIFCRILSLLWGSFAKET